MRIPLRIPLTFDFRQVSASVVLDTVAQIIPVQAQVTKAPQGMGQPLPDRAPDGTSGGVRRKSVGRPFEFC